jgi:hypothetical protein
MSRNPVSNPYPVYKHTQIVTILLISECLYTDGVSASVYFDKKNQVLYLEVSSGRYLKLLCLKTSFACCLLHAGYLLGLLFNTEDGGDMFLRNFG